MKACPRCSASIDDSARYCIECGAPQTEDAAKELDTYVQRQAEQVIAESGMDTGRGSAATDGSGSGGTATGGADGVKAAVEAELSDRERLWRRACYVLGYGTVAVAFTQITRPGAWLLLLGGIAILPPIRRLTAEPLGSPLKREVMVGLYAILVVLGILLLVLL
ncbi:zinc ribbon domain-containing protein [Halorubrum vacuolatum]|nr:zinc ribbon domain-containing protein [Halorubrum vacuolatum]